MTKIWAKIILEQKIVKSYVYKSKEKFNPMDLLNYLADICFHFDISVPVILDKHLKHLFKFNMAKFNKSDFIEPVAFDNLTLNIIE